VKIELIMRQSIFMKFHNRIANVISHQQINMDVISTAG